MMFISTTRFGDLPVDDANILTFEDGLPGFEKQHRFTFVPHHNSAGDKASPFVWLQSIDDGGLAFLAMDPRLVFSSYTPKIPRPDLESLHLETGSPEMRIFTLLTVPKGNPMGVTANLLAPVVVNPVLRAARQVVVIGDDYGLRHPLFCRVAETLHIGRGVKAQNLVNNQTFIASK